MKLALFSRILPLFIIGAGLPMAGGQPKSVLDFTVNNIEGTGIPLTKYKESVLLIVNVASECGYPP
jgi:hypothetical protein